MCALLKNVCFNTKDRTKTLKMPGLICEWLRKIVKIYKKGWQGI